MIDSKLVNKLYSSYSKETKHYMRNVHSFLDEKYGSIPDSWLGQLNLLAYNYDLFLNAKKQIKKDGLMVLNGKGVMDKHPMIKVSTDAVIQCTKLSQMFGLNAYASKKLGETGSEVDEASDFINSLIKE